MILLSIQLKIIFLAVILTLSLFGQVEYRHEPPANYPTGQPIHISIETAEIIDVVRGELFFRITGEENYQVVQMLQDRNQFFYEIPADYTTERGLEYAIVLTLSDNSRLSFPAINAMDNPHELMPVKLDDNVPLLLSPDEGSTIDQNTKEILIAISLFNLNEKIDDISLKINGREMIDRAEVYDELITLKYVNFDQGKQKLEFSYRAKGNVKKEFLWNFSIGKPQRIEQRNNYRGNVKAEFSAEKIHDNYQNISNLTTTMNGNYGNTNYDGKMYLTTRENRQQQPVNRFNLNFSGDFFDVTFGDAYPSFSELTLYGNRVRGVESKVKFGFFNLQAVWGFSKRDTRGIISTIPDTVGNLFSYQRSNYTFGQKVLGIKPSFDLGKHAIFGLYFLKVKDDTSSVAKGISGVKISDDVTILMQQKPQESLNVGMDLKLNFDKNRILWENELALSEMNKDIYGGALSLAEMDTYFEGDSIADDTITISDNEKIAIKDIPFDPENLEWLLTINPHLEPLLPVVPDSSGNIGLKQIWNMPGLSALSKLRLNYFRNYIIIKYKKIGTRYNSLVNPYLQKDYREFEIQDRIRLYDDRIVTKIGYTNRVNNYSMEKSGRYLRNAVNFGLSYYSLGILPNIDFDTYFDTRKNNINDIDSLYLSEGEYQLSDSRLKTGSSRYNLSLIKEFEYFGKTNMIQLNFSFYQSDDRVKNRLENYISTNYSSTIFRLNYAINLLKKSKFNTSVSKTSSEFGATQSDIFNFSMNFNNMERREKYWYFTRYDYSGASGMYKFINHKISSGFTCKFLRNHSLNLVCRYSFFKDKIKDKTFSDYNFNLAWYYNFQ